MTDRPRIETLQDALNRFLICSAFHNQQAEASQIEAL